MDISIALLVIISVLIIIHIMVILRQSENNKITTDTNKRLEALCKGLYSEYKKVKGPDWAKAALNDVIRDVIRDASKKKEAF